MNKRVEGSYVRVEDAMHAVQRLREEGYKKHDIYVVANSTVRNSIPQTLDAEVSTSSDVSDDMHDDDRSLWDKIKDAFTIDDYETERVNQPGYDMENDPLESYHDEIEQGNIIVLVNEDAKTTVVGDPTMTTDYTDTGVMGGFDSGVPLDTDVTDNDVDHHRLSDQEDQTVQLREEQLDIDKDEVQTGEVRISKRVVEETKNIEVPVTHEEVTIERHKVTDGDSSTSPITDMDETEEIVVPIMEEQINVSKHTDVVEEVDIHKNKVTEQKHVTDTVRKEELTIDRDGKVTKDDQQDVLDSNLHDDPDLPL